MDQFELPVKPPMMDVDLSVIDAQPTLTSAIVLCQSLAGLQDKELAGEGGIVKHTEQWSKIKGGSGFFPQDRFLTYMHRCANEAPLHWLARRSGYELVPLESETQRKLRLAEEANERLQNENALLRGLITKAA